MRYLFLISFLSWSLFCLSASAADPDGTSVSAAEQAEPGFSWSRGWGGKSDTEIKSTRDGKSRTDGYELASEAFVSKRITENFGPLVGLVWKRERRENLDFGAPVPAATGKKKKAASPSAPPPPQFTARNSLDSYYFGAAGEFRAWGRKVHAELLLNRLGEEEDRVKKGYENFATLELKAREKLSGWAKIKGKYKYTEYFRTRSGPEVDTRQSRLELSPAVFYRDFSLGLQNRLTHKFKMANSRAHADLAPFVKWEKGVAELTLKAVFTPLVTADGRTFAENWTRTPVYSAELEITL